MDSAAGWSAVPRTTPPAHTPAITGRTPDAPLSVEPGRRDLGTIREETKEGREGMRSGAIDTYLRVPSRGFADSLATF